MGLGNVSNMESSGYSIRCQSAGDSKAWDRIRNTYRADGNFAWELFPGGAEFLGCLLFSAGVPGP
jgi:hypothetical protein